MPEFAWMCLYKYDSEYTSGLKYAKLLNMAKFWIWKVLNTRVLHSVPENALTKFWKFLGL